MIQEKNLLESFQKKVIGQDHIFERLCRVIRRGEAGLTPENEPKGAFLFLGPTGTGKTETAKAMAEILDVPLIRFDMSEYSNSQKWLHDFASKLENKPTGVILLDEIEKGDKDIMDYFLQILSEALITVDLKEIRLHDYYIVMTSNLGSKNLYSLSPSEVKFVVGIRAQGFFRPEFLGRFHSGCILTYNPFTFDTIKEIAKLKIQQEMKKLAKKGYTCHSYTSAVIDKLLFYVMLNRDAGARPIVQAIQEDLADAILNSGKQSGVIDVQNGRIVFV
ncbi:MAG: ATP-dependent Clp protease ATP-binding subunit [Lentisphaeria bacterium]|nr:ATP-dependent Clp protease ATP-binding subunit [Lentisphaeria bacterium]